ncbi:MAG: hypothetical protein ACFFD4_19450 [Candidatus Odinarchaeota archaeon]
MKQKFTRRTAIITITCITGFLLASSSQVVPTAEATAVSQTGAIIADHAIVRQVMDDLVPEAAIVNAKNILHIAYEHTSHGSQIPSGMTGLIGFKEGKGGTVGLYSWNDGPLAGALDMDDDAMASYASSASDLGYADWALATENYLNDPAHSDVNVVMWSWCGQVGSYDEQGLINHYLDPMTQLENNFTGVSFVYMTGHVDGNGLDGSVHRSNEQIRQYVRENGKILFDFADIESYDPDGNYFGDKYVNDNCDYHNDTYSGNWAIEWQNSHPGEWYSCSAAHSQPLNGNMKAYAAWWLWARLAGWEDPSNPVNTTSTSTSIGTSSSTSTGTTGTISATGTSSLASSSGFTFFTIAGIASMSIVQVKRRIKSN